MQALTGEGASPTPLRAAIRTRSKLNGHDHARARVHAHVHDRALEHGLDHCRDHDYDR
jgi:hypothetical protein